MEVSHMVMANRDRESGRYTSSYSDSDFIEVVADAPGPIGTGSVADTLGCDRRTAYNRLTALRETGELSARKEGNVLIWSLAGDSE